MLEGYLIVLKCRGKGWEKYWELQPCTRNLQSYKYMTNVQKVRHQHLCPQWLAKKREMRVTFGALFCNGSEHGIPPEASASTSPVCLM